MKNATNVKRGQIKLSRKEFILGGLGMGLGLLTAHPERAMADSSPLGTIACEPFVAKSIRAHFIVGTLPSWPRSDAIVLELIGGEGERLFALIDGGFGPETGKPHAGYVNRFTDASSLPEAPAAWQRTKNYIDSLGVNTSNVAFYLGTHPHMDHMGCAAEIIEAYRPPVVLTPEYDDCFIEPPDMTPFYNYEGELVSGKEWWDNQWNYDRTLKAAYDAGIPVVTSINSWDEATFSVCGVKFTLVNWDTDYRTRTAGNKMTNANDFCWGLLVEGCGSRVFLGGDINDAYGSESRLARWVGHVDVMKLNHHGYAKSNVPRFVSALNPSIAIDTGTNDIPGGTLLKQLEGQGCRLFSTEDSNLRGMDALVVTLSAEGVVTNFDGLAQGRTTCLGNLLCCNGRYVGKDGWHAFNGNFYWTSGGIFYKGWRRVDGIPYFFNDTAEVRLGWIAYRNKWYYLSYDGRKLVWAQNRLLNINGKYYYFGSDGAMFANRWVPYLDSYYYFGADVALVRDGIAYYKGKAYLMAADGRAIKRVN